MHSPYPLNRLFTRHLLAFVCLMGCVKTEPSAFINNPPPPGGNPPSTNPPPAVTAVGLPVGSPVTKNIGPGGGSLTSDDGIIDLNVPAAALSTNTDISIQSVTNETPGGIGLSYHLMPDGTKFSKPVNLIFHYTDQDINGSHPYLMYVAYQDSLYTWKADLKNRNIDTIAKTVTEEISHFSVWTVGESLYILTDRLEDKLYSNQSINIKVLEVTHPTESSQAGGEDDLPALPQSTLLQEERVSNWKVNGQLGGNAQDGTITGTGSQVSYKAPAKIEKERTVQVSAEYKDPLILFNHGKLIDKSSKFILFLNLILLPSEFNFSVSIKYTDTYVTGYKGQTYIDAVTFDLYINAQDAHIGDGLTAIATNIINQAPTVSPAEYTVDTTTPPIKFTWLPDRFGIINVQTVSATLSSETDATIQLNHTGTIAPHFIYVAGTLNGNIGGIATEGYPTFFTLSLADSSQTPGGNFGALTINVTPK